MLVELGCIRDTNYYLSKGNQFFDAGKYDDAALQYRKALQKDPNSGQALYRLGLTQFERNAFGEAYPLLLRSTGIMPENIDAKAKLAGVSLALYVSAPSHPRILYEQVAKMSDQLLARDPQSFDGLRFKGSLRMIDRNPKEAIEYFQRANRIKPMQPDLIVGLVQALFLDNQPREGERLAQELIHREPGFGAIYDVLYNHYRGSKDSADAEKVLRLKVSNNPDQADYRIQLAGHYARQQNRAEMAAVLQPLLRDSKRFPEGALKSGDFYARMGNWTEAQADFEQGARNYPKNTLVYQKRIADAELMQGKRADAARVVDSILKDHPDDFDASRVRATLHMESGKPEDVDNALNEFGSLVKAAPDDPVLRFNYGRCWLKKGDTARAQSEFREAVRARHDFVPALFALAKMSFSQRKDAETLRYVQQILSYRPDDINARQLGIDSLIQAGRLNEAQAELAVLLKEHPDNRNVQLQLGFLDLAQKKYKDAEKVFQTVHATGQSDAVSAVGLTELYSDEQQFDKAIQMLNEELKKSPGSTATRRLLATTEARAGKYDLAISTYQELLAREPKSADLYTQLGQLYLVKGDNNSAIAAFEKAKELAPTQPLPVTLLAVSLERVRRSEEARANYRRALKLQPANPAALNNLAYLLAQDGSDLDEALSMVQRALQIQPENPVYSDTLGYVYLKKKMTGSAIQTYSSLVHRYPASSVYHYHLGMALLDTGDKAKAKAEFQSALANRPTQEDELRIKELLSHLGV